MKDFILSRWLLLILALALFGATGCSKQAKARRHLNRADSYFATGDYEKAELEYINVLRLQSTNMLARRKLAQINYEDEMLANAAALLSDLKRANTNDLEVRGKLARIMLAAGAVQQARQEADFVLQRSATNEEAILVFIDTSFKPEEINAARQRLAVLRQKAGDLPLFHVATASLAVRERNFPAAENEIKTALTMDPKFALAHWALGNLYLAQGNLPLGEQSIKTSADLSPIRSPRRIRVALLRLHAKDYEGAAAILKDLTAKAPDYVPAWLLSARLDLDQKQYDQSLADLERILRRNPNHFEAVALRSEVYLAKKETDKALLDLDRLATINPKSPGVRYQQALAAIAAKDNNRAFSSLEQALAIDRNYTPAVLLLAEMNLRKGEAAMAITPLNDLIKRDPTVQRAYMLLGSAYVADGKLNDALAIYDRASKAFPKANAEAVMMMGDILRQQGRLDDARKVFEAVLQSRPDDLNAHVQLTAIDIGAKSYDLATKRLESWMQRAPTNAEPVFQMAKVRSEQGDFKGAEALLEKTISLNPEALSAYGLLARIYYSTQKSDAALEKTKLALQRDPKNVASLLLAGMIYEEKHDFKSARDQYEKLLAVAPNHYIALNNLAFIYSEQFNDLEKAYTLSRKADELQPNDPSVADTFGWILVKRGEYSSALPLIRTAAERSPNEADIAGHLGITHYMLGDEPAARATLDKALKLTNSFSSRAEVEKCIALLNINPANADQAAISALEKRLQEKPADSVALSRLATVYEKTGKLENASALYEKAVAANPKLAIAVARLADINDKRQNSAKAMEFARNARKLDGDDPRVAQIAGRIVSKSGDVKDQEWGLGLLQEASRKQPQDPTAAYDLGWAYYTQGRLTEAETAMKSTLAMSAALPSGVAAKRLLDFLPLSDPARAAQQTAMIDQALQSDANYLPALAARAAAAQQKGDTAAAIKTLDQILTRYSGFAPAIRSFAILSAGQPGDATKALAAANRAKSLFPDDPQIDKALGVLQYQKSDYQRANRTLAEVVRKNPNDETAQYYLGMSHYQLKQPKESKVALKKAIELQPKAPFVADAQRVLNELGK